MNVGSYYVDIGVTAFFGDKYNFLGGYSTLLSNLRQEGGGGGVVKVLSDNDHDYTDSFYMYLVANSCILYLNTNLNPLTINNQQ